MEFKYLEINGWDVLELCDVYAVNVQVWFEDGVADLIYLNDEEFIDIDADLFNGLYVMVGSDPLTRKQTIIRDIIAQAIEQYDDIMDEVREELANEEAMYRELSSPYLTGRI